MKNLLSKFVDLTIFLIRSIIDQFVITEQIQVFKTFLNTLKVFSIDFFNVLIRLYVFWLGSYFYDIKSEIILLKNWKARNQEISFSDFVWISFENFINVIFTRIICNIRLTIPRKLIYSFIVLIFFVFFSLCFSLKTNPFLRLKMLNLNKRVFVNIFSFNHIVSVNNWGNWWKNKKCWFIFKITHIKPWLLVVIYWHTEIFTCSEMLQPIRSIPLAEPSLFEVFILNNPHSICVPSVLLKAIRNVIEYKFDS